jgi:hypothetical protein
MREYEKVRGSEPSHSQGNSHFGKWSLGGLPKLQKAISGVKTQTFKTQVMAKRRVGSQIASLTPDQKKLTIDPIYLTIEGVQYTVRKLSTRATTLL